MDEILQNFKKFNINEKIYFVLSIDIGVNNLGLSMSIVSDDFLLKEIIWIDLINITEYTHRVISKDECKLHHTKTFSDWLEHIYQEHFPFFSQADYILIERQPPAGFTVVEQLIFNRWRTKSYLICPVNVHCFFNIRELDYENRKIFTEGIAKKILENNKDLYEQFYFYNRRHDIADSICMLIYWLNKKHKDFLEEANKKRIKEMYDKISVNGESFDKWVDKYKYSS